MKSAVGNDIFKESEEQEKMKNNIFKSRKFKYGATAVGFTCVCIALVIIFNVVFSALANKFLWSVDMTKSQLFSISDTTRDLLKDIDKEITINFCQPYDKLAADSTTNLVYQCAREYEKAFDNISIGYFDILTNPSIIEKYATSSGSRLKTTSVVVTSDTDFRTYTLESFFAIDSETQQVLAFDGEIKLTSAILQLTSASPIAYFTIGHGEATGTSENRPALWSLLENAGYEVKTINLTTDEFDEAAKLLIINDPIQDFQGFNDAINEIEKIGKFLDDLGNLMVFVDPETPDLPELEYLLEEWGIGIEDAKLTDSVNSSSIDGFKLNAQYSTDTMGSSLHSTLRQQDSVPPTIVENARPLNLIWNDPEGVTTDSLSRRVASTVLTSYNTAEAKLFDAEKPISAQSPYPLMTITRETQIEDYTYEHHSYVMVTGSTDFATDRYLNSGAYANSAILYSAMRFMEMETVPTTIPHKYLEDQSLEITQAQANNWTLAVTIIAPVIVFGIGIYIQIRRKHL